METGLCSDGAILSRDRGEDKGSWSTVLACEPISMLTKLSSVASLTHWFFRLSSSTDATSRTGYK